LPAGACRRAFLRLRNAIRENPVFPAIRTLRHCRETYIFLNYNNKSVTMTQFRPFSCVNHFILTGAHHYPLIAISHPF
jgi:hypothetical protein